MLTEKASLPARVAVTLLLAAVCWVAAIAVATVTVAGLRWLADTLGVETVVGLLALASVSVYRIAKERA